MDGPSSSDLYGGGRGNTDFVNLEAKVEEQSQLISLLQVQLEIQTEKLEKQEDLLQALTLQVKELQLKNQTSVRSPASASTIPEVKINIVNGHDQNPSSSSSPIVNSDWGVGEGVKISDIVKEAAEEALTQSGFVYDEKSKLYLDYATGYYYDPVQKLYYNGHTRTYYSYDESTKEYKLHSQLPPIPEPEAKSEVKFNWKAKARTKIRKSVLPHPHIGVGGKSPLRTSDHNPADPTLAPTPKMKPRPKKLKLKPTVIDLEDGEISSSSSSDCGSDLIGENNANAVIQISDDSNSIDDVTEIAQAPCIRAIVLESDLSELKKGFLFIVTCVGGVIGTEEGPDNVILIPDESNVVDKRIAIITYGVEETGDDVEVGGVKVKVNGGSNEVAAKTPRYYIQDLGSETGTFLNGRRLSDSGIPSDSYEVPHGSTLKIGETTLSLHIHPGSLTCDNCEPGLMMVKEPLHSCVVAKGGKEAARKKELKKLRLKYGIEYPGSTKAALSFSPNYADRAQDRRVGIGSDNPFEKTQIASVDEAIQSDNIGFKMMAKMGWEAGKTLGQSQVDGIHEPIKVAFKQGRGGLGSEETHLPAALSLTAPPSRKHYSNGGGAKSTKSQMLKKTRARFQQITSPPAKVQPSTSSAKLTPEEVTLD